MPNLHTNLFRTTLFLCSLFAVACGGDSTPDGTGGGHGAEAVAQSEAAALQAVQATGGDAGRALIDLSAEQATRLCRRYREAAHRVMTTDEGIVGACTLAGRFSAAFAVPDDPAAQAAHCETSRDACRQQAPPEAAERLDDCGETLSTWRDADCSATVAEYQACAEEQLLGLGAVAATMARVGCDDAEDDGLGDLFGGSTVGSTCATFQQACPIPSLFDPDGTR